MESVQHVENTQYLYLLKKIYKMQHLEGSGTYTHPIYWTHGS